MKPQPQAIKPDVFADFKNLLHKQTVKNKSQEEVDEIELAKMANLEGWRVLKAHIEGLKAEIDKLNEATIEGGASFEIIGQSAIITNLTKQYLSRIIEKVSDAREARESAGGAGK